MRNVWHKMLVCSLGVLRALHDVGDECLVIVEVELRPFGLARRSTRVIAPCASPAAAAVQAPANELDLADRAVGRLAEFLVGLLEVAVLEAVEPEQQVRHAFARPWRPARGPAERRGPE